jgi:hypothetical protein
VGPLAGLVFAGLQAATVELDHRRRRWLGVIDRQAALFESLDLSAAQGPPFLADASGEPLQVGGADAESGQLAQVGGGVGEGGGLLGLSHGQAQGGRAVAPNAELEFAVQREKKRPDRSHIATWLASR